MPVTPLELAGSKILITGPTGQVALPVVKALADIADVTALARFSREKDKTRIEALGAKTYVADLADKKQLQDLDDDFDYVLNFAVVKTGNFDYDLAANGEGVGNLMMHCRKVKAFLHFSSTAVYQYEGQEPRKETDPLGDNHRSMFPTYSIAKIAAETVCRFVAHQFEIPTIIARLSVPYSDDGGWPYFHLLMMQQDMAIDIHPDQPNYYNLLHFDDYIEKIPYLLAAATPEVEVVNFGGSEKVSVEEWCEYITELTGFKPEFNLTETAFGSLSINHDKMHELIGPTKVSWKEGVYRMIKNLSPDLLINEKDA